jgi:hypothetical protein
VSFETFWIGSGAVAWALSVVATSHFLPKSILIRTAWSIVTRNGVSLAVLARLAVAVAAFVLWGRVTAYVFFALGFDLRLIPLLNSHPYIDMARVLTTSTARLSIR